MTPPTKNQPADFQNLRTASSGLFLIAVIALPFDNALFHFAGVLLLFITSLTLFRTGVSPLLQILAKRKKVLKTFLAIAVIMALSNFWNGQGTEAWYALSVFIIRYVLLFFVLLFLLENRFLTFRFIFLACMVSLSVQFLPFLPEIVTGKIFDHRFQGFLSNPNIAGLYAGIGVLLGVFLAAESKIHMAVRLPVSAAMILVMVVVLLASGNRGGWVALVGSLGCFSLFTLRKNYKKIIPLLALVLLVSFYVFSQFAVPKARLDFLVSGYPALRDTLWTHSFQLFLQQPILGYGLDTRAVLLTGQTIYSEHNIFLSVLLGLGSLGAIAYSFLLVFICRPAWERRNAVGLSAMTFLMGVGFFGFDFYRDQTFMVSFVIVSLVCLRDSENYVTSSLKAHISE